MVKKATKPARVAKKKAAKANTRAGKPARPSKLTARKPLRPKKVAAKKTAKKPGKPAAGASRKSVHKKPATKLVRSKVAPKSPKLVKKTTATPKSSLKVASKGKTQAPKATTRKSAARPTAKAVPARKGPVQPVAKPTPKQVEPAPLKGGKAAPAPAKSASPEDRQKLLAEQVAKLASQRAQAMASKSGKNGKGKNKLAEALPALSAADVEARRTRLKNLIVLGKERGYLTYGEINDHLPDDVLDAEQIEGVISMINDMGIQVYDVAPDAETLLLNESTPAVAAEDVDEEAEAAASNLDSEFGRTTDPVRMYMREMGSVELLTREGEIEIAKRIEEGLKHMIQAISACPMTVAQILELADKIERDEIRVDELVDGLLDFAPAEELAAIEQGTEEDEEEDETEEDDAGAASALAAENLERLRVAALEKLVQIPKHKKKQHNPHEKQGASGNA
jgi:RNA polymerase primary sigma factor